MYKRTGQAAIIWIARFIELQCFLTLVSLPILLFWGLPISLLTFAGNLIFTPFLTAFLLFSTLLFLTYLLHLPDAWLIWLLEQVTRCWHWCLQQATTAWLVPLQKPAFIWCSIIFIGALIIVHVKKPKKIPHRALLIASYLAVVCIALMYQQPTIAQLTIPYGRKEIVIAQEHGIITLNDPAAFGCKPSPQSWIEYTLLPALISNFGTKKIDVVRSDKSSQRVLEAITTLCQIAQVKELYLTAWDKKDMSKNMARAYRKLKQVTQEKGTQINIVRP